MPIGVYDALLSSFGFILTIAPTSFQLSLSKLDKILPLAVPTAKVVPDSVTIKGLQYHPPLSICIPKNPPLGVKATVIGSPKLTVYLLVSI